MHDTDARLSPHRSNRQDRRKTQNCIYLGMVVLSALGRLRLEVYRKASLDYKVRSCFKTIGVGEMA